MSMSKISAKEANTSSENSHESGDNNDINESISFYATSTESNEIIDFREANDNEIPTFAVRMLNLCRELAIFCLIMITYAALTKDPPKIIKAPAAYPFFPKDSFVTDWYRGQISKAIEQARTSDVAFVMFYAPWDAESQSARKEFEIAAKYMQNYVTFAAVNCWQPNSECRNQYSKVYKWPVLIAYPSHGRGIQYNGLISAPHMIRFLQKVCNPIFRLSNERPRDFEDAYVVVELDTRPGSIDFAVLYTAALKYLEKDPLHRISFYVKPGIFSEPALYFHLWNETLLYPIFDREWRPDAILHWLYQNLHQITTWIVPSGTKSLLLSNSLQKGPSLILFTPKNPLHLNTDYYTMVQEIAQDYFNCDNSIMTDLHTLSIKLKRSGNLLQYRMLKEMCKPKQDISGRKIISHLNPKIWVNTSSCTEKPHKKDCDLLEDRVNYFCSSMKSGNYIEFSPSTTEKNEKSCGPKSYEVYKTSMLTGENDPKSPENLIKLLHREKCRQFLTAERLQPAIFENKLYDDKKSQNISGLSCKSNKSLTFIAMDSLTSYHFAERLGIDLTKNVDKSAAVIINEKMESHYIMKDPIHNISLREFILNFTNNFLSRSLESNTTLRLKNDQNLMVKKSNREKWKIFIEELDTNSFLPTVLQENKAVVVFYYTKQCSFCNGISYALLTAAKKLMFVDNLSFTRIDGDANNLPWEYTMDSYPTILFFPANGKSESRVFPSNIPITVPNIIGFILTNLDPTIKLQAMWSICNQTKYKEEKFSCYSSLQVETLTVIDRILRDWRKSNKRQKQVLLHKLIQLRQLHLLFAHSPQKRSLIEAYLKKLNSKLSHSKDYHNLNNSVDRKS